MIQQKQVLQFNGQVIENLEEINEMGKIKLYAGTIKNVEQPIHLIEIDLNFNIKNQFQFLVFNQINYEFYQDKFQNAFIKTTDDCLLKLNQNQIVFWDNYFQSQAFKILPIRQKHRLFNKFFRKFFKQETQDISLLYVDQLGISQLITIDQRLYRKNAWIDKIDLNINQEDLKIDSNLFDEIGQFYFTMLTDLDMRDLTKDQKIQLINDSPIYEWQKQKIINLLNPLHFEQIQKQNLIVLMKEEQFDIIQQEKCQENNDHYEQKQEIISQYSIQQSQIQSQFNYLYYHINKAKDNKIIYQEYKQLNQFNNEFQNYLKNIFTSEPDQNLIEDKLKFKLDEFIRLFNQMHFNLQNTLCKSLMQKSQKLQLKLNKFYNPTQFLGQFGSLNVGAYSKLQIQNKNFMQTLEQQINKKLQNNTQSILEFNQILTNLTETYRNIKLQYKQFKTQLIKKLIKVRSLLELNLSRVRQDFENVIIQYVSKILSLDQSEQFTLISELLEQQMILKEKVLNPTNKPPDFVYKQQNKQKIDILQSCEQLQELEFQIRELLKIMVKSNKDLGQFDQQNQIKIKNNLKQQQSINHEKLIELQSQFKHEIQSIRLIISRNQKILDDQMVIYYQARIQDIIEKQNNRFQLIQELLQQNSVSYRALFSISFKIDEEKVKIQNQIQQEMEMILELQQKNSNITKDSQQINQEKLDLEFEILENQYRGLDQILELEKQQIKNKYTDLDIGLQEQILIMKKIEVLLQEQTLLQIPLRSKKQHSILDNLLNKLKLKSSFFKQFCNYAYSLKDKMNLQVEQNRFFLDIEKQQMQIKENLQKIKIGNLGRSIEEQIIELQQLKSKLEQFYQEKIRIVKLTALNAFGYYHNLTLIIISKFYHLKRFHQRIIEASEKEKKQQIEQQDLEFMNQQIDEFNQIETKIEYYKKEVIENCCMKVQFQNLLQELEVLENQIEKQNQYLKLVIESHNDKKLKMALNSQMTINQIKQFTEFNEFSKMFQFKILVKNIYNV